MPSSFTEMPAMAPMMRGFLSRLRAIAPGLSALPRSTSSTTVQIRWYRGTTTATLREARPRCSGPEMALTTGRAKRMLLPRMMAWIMLPCTALPVKKRGISSTASREISSTSPTTVIRKRPLSRSARSVW